MDALSILTKTFKFEKFRDDQEEIIESIFDSDNKGILTVMPTGAGKSILYQLPALLMDGLTIVISPLVSLMKDQVDFLKSKGIMAEFYNSSLSTLEKRNIEFALCKQQLKLLYIAPERFSDSNFFNALKLTNKIGLFAVDESHCISSFGHDFRPAYRELSKIIEFLEPKQIIALTATATKRVQKDICNQLNIPNAKKYIKGFYRPDLKLVIESCSNANKIDRIIDKIVFHIKNKEMTGIVYTPTRKKAEELVDELKKENIPTILYHAGLSDKLREKTQSDWFANGGIVIATVAFGMGINKSDVRFVIHAGMPSSIENYYQEIGRASRDGKGATCTIFFNERNDINLQKFFIDMSYPSRYNISNFWEWCCKAADKTNMIYKTQKEMGKLCSSFMKEHVISGCISKLKENKFIETLGTGKYKIEVLKNINEFNFQQLEEKRRAKLDTMFEMSNFLTNISECRMLQILHYFDDYSHEKECLNCDICSRKLRKSKPIY